MIEIRIHGRGGQGNVAAAYLLAAAAIVENKYGQAFPAFGAERRGAPVVSFVRIADQQSRRRCQVLDPAFLIVQDQALLHVPGVLDGLPPHGAILVNSTLDSEVLSEQTGRTVQALPADTLSMEYLGRPLPNTTLLSAFLSLTQLLPLSALVAALEARFSGELLKNNVRLVEDIAQRVPVASWQVQAHAAST